MYSSGVTFQQEQIQQIMPQGAQMLNEKVQIAVGFKSLRSYGKKKNIGQIKMNR